MKNLKGLSAIAVAVTVALSGCSSTHSPKIQEAMDRSAKTFEGGYEEQIKKYKPKRETIGKVYRGNAYHDVNDYTLVQHDQRKLPEQFKEPAIIKESEDNNETYTVDEFSALIYESYGISLDVSSPDLKMLDKESKEKEASLNAFAQPGVSADATGQFEAVSQIVGNKPSTDRDSLKLKPFKYNGTLKGLLDYVSQLNGLKWKYDVDTNRAYLYAFETKTFNIYDFGDKVEIDSSITTDTSQESESTSGGSSKESTRENKSDGWKEIRESIDNLLSDDYGKATYNTKSGLISITDSDYNLAQIGKYIDKLNKLTTTEIIVEFKIIHFKYDDGDNHSINQNYLNDKLQSNLLGSFDINFGSGSMSPNISGNLGAFQELMQGNFLSLATDSHQFLMGFLNTVGTAEVAYETQVEVLNNDIITDQMQETEEYISSIERSSYQSGEGQENISTERDVAVDGMSFSVRPRVAGDRVMVSYSVANSDFIALKEAGLGAGLEGVKLKTQGAINLEHTASLINGVPKVVKYTHQNEVNTTSQGMFDDLLWVLGGSETRNESKSAVIVTMTAYYNN